MNLYYRHSWIFIVDYHAQDPEKDNKCDAEYGVDCPRKSLPEPDQNLFKKELSIGKQGDRHENEIGV